MKINTILFFGLVITFFSCKSQTNQKSTLGKVVKELDKTILDIHQDKNENYWFVSKSNGVYKHDGKKLTLFTSEDGLSSNSVLDIQEDQFGNLYFDTHQGVSKFDGQQFVTLPIAEGNAVDISWKLDTNDLWFRIGIGGNGPYRYDGEFLHPLKFPRSPLEYQFHSQNPTASYSPYSIYSMYEDRSGNKWFGTSSLGWCRFDGASISWLYEEQLQKTPSGGDFGMRSIIEDQNGDFWFCNTRYRYQISSNQKNGKPNIVNYKRKQGILDSTASDEDSAPYFLSIIEDDNGHLWMITYDEGVWKSDGEQLTNYPIKDGDAEVLLFSIYKDRQGTLWLGTYNAGVYKFNGKTFEKFKL
ncbi:MAG: two-component regulator propeller domain-containing protein [Bacteroidota bacterium]